MDLERFENAINDGAVNRSDELTSCMKELLKEHKELKKETAPGLWNDFRKKLASETGDSYWSAILLVIPLSITVTTLVALLLYGLAFGGTHQGYYLYASSRDRCTKIIRSINWGEDSIATDCIENPIEALVLLNELNGEQNDNSSNNDAHGNRSLQSLPRTGETQP